MSKIHVTKGGANHGPFTVEEINAKLKGGEFEPTDKSWMEGMAGWLPLTDQAFVEAGVVLPAAEAAPPPPEAAPPPPHLPGRSGACCSRASSRKDPSLADKAKAAAEKAKAAADQAGSSDGDMISKPDANPVLALVLTWFVFGLGHMIVNGQTNKWIWTLVMTMVGSSSALSLAFLSAY